MPIYEKYVGRSRDDFVTLEDLNKNFKLKWNDDFNFAYDVMDTLAAEKPNELALLWVGENGEEKRITYAELKTESDRTANYFWSLGIRKGDRVLLTLRRSYYFWYCMLALHKIGAIAVQATHMLMTKDYTYRCNLAKIKCAIITGVGICADEFDKGEGQYETVELKLLTGRKHRDGWHDFEAEREACSADWTRPTGDDATKATDIMLLSFSSGTTGYPKMITHDFTYPLGHICTGVFWHRVEEGGLHFTISDTGWLKSLWGKFYGQWFGESAVFVYDFDRFDGADILSKLEKYRVTTFCAPPTMYRMMLLKDVSKYDLSSLKHCCTAGEAMNPDIYDQWKEQTGLKIFEGFGQTETTLALATIYPWMQPRPGSMGLPAAGYQVSVLDPEGRECEPGVTGEVCVRADSPNSRPRGLFIGYHDAPEATAAQWHDGYYHTGDTAYRDELGLFWYVGRNDDIIKSSGYRIGPFEVESVLSEHPAVLECAVTGVPDPVRGFNVKATIILNDGYEPSDELTKELQTYVKKNTAPYKYPRVVEYVKELPKTISGKVRRVEIREHDAKK